MHQDIKRWNFSATGTGDIVGPLCGEVVCAQLHVTGTGTVTAVGRLQVTNTPDISTSWQTFATLTATGTTTGIDGTTAIGSWRYFRFVLDTLTNSTNAVATVGKEE